jgi:pectate lyase
MSITHHVRTTANKLQAKPPFRLSVQVIFILVAVMVGSVYLLSIHAASPVGTVEPENGLAVSPTSVTSDAAASGGKAVQFGNSVYQPPSHDALLALRSGFGAHATGGTTDCAVTTLDDSGPGSLRDCASVGGRWVSFRVNGAIVLVSPIPIHSSTTIDGRGSDVTITTYNQSLGNPASGAALMVDGQSNVIITNLKFAALDSVPGNDAIDKCCDAIQFAETVKNNTPMTDLWVFHNSFDHTGDGADDISSTGPITISATISWNYYTNILKVDLLSPISTDGNARNPNANITVDHNYFNHNASRMTDNRQANVHLYNNYIRDWNYSTHISTASSSRDNAQLIAQNNIYDGIAGSKTIGCDSGHPGALSFLGNLLLSGASAPTMTNCTGPATFNPAASYSFNPDPADATLQAAIIAGAGWQSSPSN